MRNEKPINTTIDRTRQGPRIAKINLVSEKMCCLE